VSTSLAARFAVFAAVAACVVCPSASTAEPTALKTKSIVVLHTYGQQSLFRPVFDRALQQALTRRGMDNAEVFVETLETNRFPGDKHATLFRHYLREKYVNRKIDVVITVWDRALVYVLENRHELFPGAPVTAIVTGPRSVPAENQVAQVTAGDRIFATATLALKLHPNTRRIFVIDGSLEGKDDGVQKEFARQLVPLAPRVSIEFLNDLAINELLERVKALSDDSLVLFARQTMRSHTQSMTQIEAVGQVSGASRVPVYAASDQLIGRGVVGGVVYRTEALAEAAADTATQLLSGTPAADLAVRETHAVPIVDWRQIQRWNIDAALLPAGTDVQFREFTFWEQNRAYIAFAVTVFLIQSALIAGLLLQRSRRRRAEGALLVNEHALQVSQEDTRRLAGRLIHAQEVERARIARELHDDLSQKVALLAMDIHQVALSEVPALRGRAKVMSERAAEIGTDLHNLAYELHPAKLQILGLVTATQLLCRDLAARHHVAIDFLNDHMPLDVPSDQSLCLFRITQEALQNVVRHSGARRAVVRLTGLADSLQLEISDTGTGFDASKLGDGMGLLSMRERVNFLDGRMKIWSKPGMGTCVSVQVPVAPTHAIAERPAARIA
jgi:signal transduction histidine kinase